MKPTCQSNYYQKFKSKLKLNFLEAIHNDRMILIIDKKKICKPSVLFALQ